MPGSLLALTAIGALVVFTVGAFTMALQCLFGIIGIGLAVLVFVVLGNPSAGGVYPAPMMPPFWRAIGSLIPNGAGTSATKSIAYFGSTNLGVPLLVLVVWAVIGTGVAFLAVLRGPRVDDGEIGAGRPVEVPAGA